jgi:hypothetical protein
MASQHQTDVFVIESFCPPNDWDRLIKILGIFCARVGFIHFTVFRERPLELQFLPPTAHLLPTFSKPHVRSSIIASPILHESAFYLQDSPFLLRGFLILT